MIFIDVIQQKRSVIARLNYAWKESFVSTGEEKRWLLSSSRDKTIKTSGPGAGRRMTQEKRVSVPLCRFFAQGNWAGCDCIMPTFSKPSPFLFFIWGFPLGNFALKLSGGQQPHLWTAHFVAPNGTSFPNPIHNNAWASLKALQAPLVRFVPKFRDPKKNVAELDAPTKSKMTWDFFHILPQLEDFMDPVWTKSYGGSQFCHSALLAFWRCREQDAELLLPENPDEPFFRYVRGNRKNLLDPSGKTLASYLGRLLSYIVKGEFVDEDGVKHTWGPAYSRFNRKNGQAEHSYTVDQCPGRIIFLHFLFLDFSVVFEGHSCKPNFSRKPNDDVEVHPWFWRRRIRDDRGSWWSRLRASFHGNWRRCLQQCWGCWVASPFPQLQQAWSFSSADRWCLNSPLCRRQPSTYSAFRGFYAWMKDFKDSIVWNAAGATYAKVFATLVPLGVEAGVSNIICVGGVE